ncbi:MAG: spore coat protein CotJB [Lachnospiraceae bacterium]|nr:spore coat protein CotJB [Lachnospiraceae bacterium]
MKEIYAVSFALNDLTLYLDTHPDCQKGARIYHELLKLLTQFARKFYPLTHLSVITGGCERMNGSTADRRLLLRTRARRSARMCIRGAKALLPKFTVIEYTIKGISRKMGDFFCYNQIKIMILCSIFRVFV